LAEQGFDLDTGRPPRQVTHHDVQLPRDQDFWGGTRGFRRDLGLIETPRDIDNTP
jgi:hypothetical protein